MPVITRRTMGAGLGAAALAAGHGARADLPALETAARAEGTVNWYVAQMSGEAAEAMGRRFTRRYPGIAVSVIRTTGQVAYERLSQELKNNTPSCDVFSSTDISQYPALIKRNALAHYEPVNASELATPYRGLGEKGFYYPTTGSLQILIYNTKTVTGADIPKRCTDLLDPKFNHRVAVAHPAFSGYFGQWVLAMRRLYGWAYFEKLATNNPRVGRSGNDPITLLNAGECVVVMQKLLQVVQGDNADKLLPGIHHREKIVGIGEKAVGDFLERSRFNQRRNGRIHQVAHGLVHRRAGLFAFTQKQQTLQPQVVGIDGFIV